MSPLRSAALAVALASASPAQGNATESPAIQPEAQVPAGTRDVVLPLDEPAERRAEEGRAGLLGGSLLLDLLCLLGAALLGALLALFSPWSRATARLEREQAMLLDKIRRLQTSIDSKTRAPAAPPAPQPPRFDPIDTRRKPVEAAPEPAARPTAKARAADDGAARHAAMDKALQDYLRLVATKGAKPRQFSELLAAFPDVRSVRFDGGGLALAPYLDGDANQFFVAAGDGRRFAVVPTYDYIADFPIAFSTPVQNPELVRQLFDLDVDESGQLRVGKAAILSVDEAGAPQIDQRGSLSGFRS
jgi:hypothetical protein